MWSQRVGHNWATDLIWSGGAKFLVFPGFLNYQFSSRFLSSSPSWNPHFTFCMYGFDYSSASCKWNQTVFVFCVWLISLIKWGFKIPPRCSRCHNVRRNTDWNHLPWPGTVVTICMIYSTTGEFGKEHEINKPPPTEKIWERSKGDATCPTILPESSLLESVLAEQCVCHQDGRTLSQNDWPETTWKLIPSP